MQSTYVQEPQALKVLGESQDRIRAMALVHERLYASPDLARIDVAEYLQSSVGYLYSLYGHRALGATPNIRAQDISLGIDTAIPCGMIISELVSNALKHAFPPGWDEHQGGGETGEILIAIRSQEPGLLVLEIRDNGVGLPPGVDPENPESLGLRLVKLLTQQIRGKMEIDGKAGTAFKITFPDSNGRAVPGEAGSP
jgi:two-component sensor histidine kinase